MARTINLLPKPIQKTRQYELLLKSLKVFVVASFILYAFAIGSQIVTQILLTSTLSKTKAEVVSIQKTSSQEVSQATKDAVKAVNTKVSEYRTLRDGIPQVSTFLKEFISLVPPNIKINALTADMQTKKVFVSGLAETRENVLTFYNHLATAKDIFTQINFPFDNIVRETQVPFSYSFLIQDSLLKIKQ